MDHKGIVSYRRGLCFTVLVVSLVAVFICRQAMAEDVYEFGAMFPMTGPAAFIGEVFAGAVNQAVDEINAKGGVDGAKLKAVIEDHKASAEGGADAMNRIILNKRIAYTLGSFVDPNLSAQPIAARKHVLIMNSGGQADSLLNLPYLYNNHVMGGYQMPPFAKFLFGKGFRKAASLVNNSAEGWNNRDAFLKTWKKLGGSAVASELYEITEMDFATQLSKIKAAQPDVIFVVATALTTATILKQANEQGIKAPIAGPWIRDSEVMIPAGRYAEGAYSVCTFLDYNSTMPFAHNYITNFKEKYAPKGAWAEWFNANAYENVYIFAELVKRVKAKGGNPLDGEQLLKALNDKPEFQSVFGAGTLRFTKEHGVLKDVVIELIQGGKPVPQQVISYKDLKKD